jgi:hypothetical protein
VLSSCIGLVAGLGAIVFYLAITWSTQFFLGQVVGYLPPSPSGEGATVLRGMDRPWLLPLVVGLGGLVSGLIVFNLAAEAEGHGTDAAIAAIDHRQGRVRGRIPPIKLIASAITIGSGGSGGREGPAAQISAGFGSLLGQWLNLKPLDRRIAVAAGMGAGMGAGIGAIFRAPLGGAQPDLALGAPVQLVYSVLHRTRRGRSLPEDTSVFEVKLADNSPVIGSSLREANLPPSVLVVAIHRAGATIFPRADSRLEAGDVLTVVADPTREAELREFFDATEA